MEIIDLSVTVLLMLCLAAMVAGFVDTLVGGGGLITLPALMMAGIPPIFALGTNKLQSVVGTGTASFVMFRRKKVSFKSVRGLMLAAFIGSIIGTIGVQFITTDVLNIIIPLVIFLIAVYFTLSPNQTSVVQDVRMSEGTYTTRVVPSIGFYDGMFGPGTGSFYVLSGVSLQGQEIIEATAIAKTLNFATNLASLLVFIFFGKIIWLVGGVMMLGQVIGASIGARTLLTINPELLRYLVIVACCVMLVTWFVSS